MKRRLISSTSFLLAGIIFYFSSGYYLLFFLQQMQIKEFVQQQILQEDHIDVLAFSASETLKIEWLDKGEFIYMGTLYDVKSVEVIKNTTYIKCYKDISERQLISALKKHINDNLASSGNSQSKVKTSFFIAFFEDFKTSEVMTTPAALFPYAEFSENPVSCFHKTFSPPPERTVIA